MPQRLKAHISREVELSESEFERLFGFFSIKKLKKRQFLLQEGDVCKYLAFVIKGCLRSYTIDDKSEEHIIQFALEDWWITDQKSFQTKQPATLNIDTLEDSEVLLISRENYDLLCKEIPKSEHYFRILLERNNIAALTRISQLIGSTAEDRYLNFINTYPKIFQRVPQNQIASYLGITPQSLSRIRKELTER